MIFPATLPLVTFYMVRDDAYHELPVSSCQTVFSFETFYSREAISAKKVTKFNGMRFEMRMSLDASTRNADFRSFFNAVLAEHDAGNGRMRLYLRAEASIGEQNDYIDVSPTESLVNHFCRNQITRTAYDISVTGIFAEVGMALAYVVDNDGNFIFNNDERRIMAQLNPY